MTENITSVRALVAGVIAMTTIVAASNYLVQFAINDWMTWAAFTYPVSFLVTDLCNRTIGPSQARRIVFVGFALALVLSAWLATPRIAIASGSAFLSAQLLDVFIFNRIRHARRWWLPPLASSTIASAVDTMIFFSVAFIGTPVPWVSLATGDYLVKLGMAMVMLLPFGIAVRSRRFSELET